MTSVVFDHITPNDTHSHTIFWGCVSIPFGRALAWHASGHRFDPGILHQKSTVLRWKRSAFLFASADADNAVRLALSTLEPKIAGALEHQFSDVALHKHSVVRTIYFEFHAVAAFHLKGRIIGRERMQQLQDNDMKYRYLLMQGQADGETFDMLEKQVQVATG